MDKQKEVNKKPTIIVTLLKEDDKIVEMHIKKIVRKHGNIAYVPLPKELTGKYVEVIYKNG